MQVYSIRTPNLTISGERRVSKRITPAIAGVIVIKKDWKIIPMDLV
jgi:3-dehydroquinate synthase class II